MARSRQRRTLNRISALVLGGGAALCLTSPTAAQEPAPGTIRTVAGNGKAGLTADGLPGIQASLNVPTQLAVDANGVLYIADFGNHRIARLGRDGLLTTIAGTGVAGYSGDGGPATKAQINLPTGIAIDAVGNLYIGDLLNHRIRKITVDGTISTIAGTGKSGSTGDGGPATEAKLNVPHAVTTDALGNVYFVEPLNQRVRRVTPDGIISTVAGSGSRGFSGDGGPATQARLYTPHALAVDAAGNLYIGDFGNNRVRMVSADGVIRTIAGGGNPPDKLGDGGPATSAALAGPLGLAFDAGGALYIADNRNRRVRRMTPDGIITTIAGTGAPGFAGDGGPALQALLSGPWGVAVDGAGTLYLADTGLGGADGLTLALQNNRVRAVAGVAPPR